MSNHFDTMVQRGPDNVDGSKYTSEVRFFDQLYCSVLLSATDICVIARSVEISIRIFKDIRQL